jgi:hypothetical protein
MDCQCTCIATSIYWSRPLAMSRISRKAVNSTNSSSTISVPKSGRETLAELQAELRELGIPSNGSSPGMKVIDESNTREFRRQHIKYESEPGIEIGGDLYIPTSCIPSIKPMKSATVLHE